MSAAYYHETTTEATNESTDLVHMSSESDFGGILAPHEYILARGLANAINVIISLVGIITNVFNGIVFVKMGLRDSVTVTFFCLALCDFGFMFCAAVIAVSQLVFLVQQLVGFDPDFSPTIIFITAGNFGLGMCQGSIIVTTYLAVQRCCCVALPFNFRNLFTFNRTLLVLVMIGLYTLSMSSLLLSSYTVQKVFDLGTNRTRFQLLTTSHKQKAGPLLNSLDSAIVLVAQVMTVCLIIMAVCLRRSVHFRERSAKTLDHTGSEETVATSTTTSDNPPSATHAKKEKTRANSRIKATKTSELQVIKSVALICILFIVCNTSRHIHLALLFLLPGYSTFGRYSNLFFFAIDVQTFTGVLNSSTNFFIYISVNTKFRETIVNVFCNSPPRTAAQ